MKKLKAILTICLAGAFVVSAAACEITVKPDPNNPDKDITIEVPDPNQNQTGNQTGNEQGGSQQGSQGTPNTPSNPGSQQGSTPGTDKPTPVEPQQPDYSQYSKMLQSILTSDYYNDLIARYLSGNYYAGYDQCFNEIECIPFTFLKNHGEDIESIKNNEIRVNTFSFTFDSEKDALYHKVTITYDNGNKDYMKQYFLKYDLSDYKQEFEEFKKLHQGAYAQTNFLFQEIDAHIDPENVELISEFCIDEDTYKNLINSYNESKKIAPVFNSTVNDFIVLDGQWDRDVYIADVLLLSIDAKNKTISGGKIAKAKLNFDYVSNVTFENNIFKMKHFRNFTTQEISETSNFTYYRQSYFAKDLVKTV